MSRQEGYEDVAKNYPIITYMLDQENGDKAKLTYCREKIPIDFERKNKERYLTGMLENIKRPAEKKQESYTYNKIYRF